MRLRFWLVLLVFVGVSVGLIAQEETEEPAPLFDNFEWVLVDLDAFTMRIPPDWTPAPIQSDGYTIELQSPNGTYMNVQIIPLGDVLSIEELEAQTVADPPGGVLVDSSRASFPFGEAVLLDANFSEETGTPGLGEGTVLRQWTYAFTVGNQVVLMAYGGIIEPSNVFEIDEGNFVKVMRTIQRDEATVGDPDWPVYTSPDGLLTVQVPPDFEDTEAENPAGLTLRQPDDFTLVIISSRELDDEIDLAGFEGALVNNYEDNGDTVIQSAIIGLPIGDTVFVHAESELVLDDGTVIPQTEYRYLTMRGKRMINVTLIVDTELFSDYALPFITIMDTLRLNEIEDEEADE